MTETEGASLPNNDVELQKQIAALQELQESLLPKNLRLIRAMNLTVEKIQSILYLSNERQTDESFEDYKLRQWLQSNLLKYRHYLPSYREWINRDKKSIQATA